MVRGDGEGAFTLNITLNTDTLQIIGQARGSLFACVLGIGGVDIEGHFACGVAEIVLDGFDVHTGAEQGDGV